MDIFKNICLGSLVPAITPARGFAPAKPSRARQQASQDSNLIAEIFNGSIA